MYRRLRQAPRRSGCSNPARCQLANCSADWTSDVREGRQRTQCSVGTEAKALSQETVGVDGICSLRTHLQALSYAHACNYEYNEIHYCADLLQVESLHTMNTFSLI